MSSNVVFNGTTYSIPDDGDFNWGPQLTAYFIDLATGTFQRSGGTFTLSAEADFGATYGLRASYVKSRAANPSGTGVFRLGNTESVSWRNAANNADLPLTVDSSNNFLFNSKTVLFSGLGLIVNADVNASAAIAYSKLNLSGSIVNADINASAAIAYSKLNLATSIVNADISNSAAIAYSKLNLATSIVNADIASAAAIAYSKLAALTASRLLVSNGSGAVSVSAVTSTEAGYLSGVTSAIQTQIDTKPSKYYLIFNDTKSSGTDGGTSSTGTNTRVLNTTVVNTISGASLASNQITLPAGTYKVEAYAPYFNGSKGQLYLYNTTDAALVTGCLGTSSYSTGTGTVGISPLRGGFTIAGTKTFELRHYIESGVATNGLGVASTSGLGEVYAVIQIEKV